MPSIRDQLVNRFRKSKTTRDAFVDELINERLPLKIRALRTAQKMSQNEFAGVLGKKKQWISMLEDPNYGKFTLKTLKEVAAGLNIALYVDLVAFSDVIDRAVNFSEVDLKVATFDEEFGTPMCAVPSLDEENAKIKEIIVQDVAVAPKGIAEAQAAGAGAQNIIFQAARDLTAGMASLGARRHERRRNVPLPNAHKTPPAAYETVGTFAGVLQNQAAYGQSEGGVQ